MDFLYVQDEFVVLELVFWRKFVITPRYLSTSYVCSPIGWVNDHASTAECCHIT